MASPSHSDDGTTAPKQFGQYTVVRKIGDGGMGAVYEARHGGLGKRVAIKVLLPEMASKEEIALRFVREGQAAARIRHPHVVDVYDVGAAEGSTWLVMELLEGSDLESVLETRGAMPVTEVLTILLPVISAVGAAHREGVVHRDLKPANIFLSKDSIGRVLPKVVDFGISKIVEDDPGFDLTRSAAVLGTPYYMAPEQVKSIKRTDARSDQHALGVILYEALTGRHPFNGESLFDLMTAITNGNAVPANELEPSVPAGVSAAIQRAMRSDPAERFPSVREFGQALYPFADELTRAMWNSEFGERSAPTPPAIPSREPSPQRAPAPVASTAATIEQSGTIASFESEVLPKAPATAPQTGGRKRTAIIAGAAGACAIAIAVVAIVSHHPASNAVAEPSTSQVRLPASTPTASAVNSAAQVASSETSTPASDSAASAPSAAPPSSSGRQAEAKVPTTTHGKNQGGSKGPTKPGDGAVRGANSAWIIH